MRIWLQTLMQIEETFFEIMVLPLLFAQEPPRLKKNSKKPKTGVVLTKPVTLKTFGTIRPCLSGSSELELSFGVFHILLAVVQDALVPHSGPIQII